LNDYLSGLDEFIERPMLGGMDAVGKKVGGLVTVVGPAVRSRGEERLKVLLSDFRFVARDQFANRR